MQYWYIFGFCFYFLSVLPAAVMISEIFYFWMKELPSRHEPRPKRGSLKSQKDRVWRELETNSEVTTITLLDATTKNPNDTSDWDRHTATEVLSNDEPNFIK